MPPTAAAFASRPALLSDAFRVDSSSVAGILLTARPAAAIAARVPRRIESGAVSGTNRRSDASSALTTRSAARIDRPAAIPWCRDARGMSDGPNESKSTCVFNGADALFVIGLARSAAHTAVFAATAPALMNPSSSCRSDSFATVVTALSNMNLHRKHARVTNKYRFYPSTLSQPLAAPACPTPHPSETAGRVHERTDERGTSTFGLSERFWAPTTSAADSLR